MDRGRFLLLCVREKNMPASQWDNEAILINARLCRDIFQRYAPQHCCNMQQYCRRAEWKRNSFNVSCNTSSQLKLPRVRLTDGQWSCRQQIRLHNFVSAKLVCTIFYSTIYDIYLIWIWLYPDIFYDGHDIGSQYYNSCFKMSW